MGKPEITAYEWRFVAFNFDGADRRWVRMISDDSAGAVDLGITTSWWTELACIGGAPVRVPRAFIEQFAQVLTAFIARLEAQVPRDIRRINYALACERAPERPMLIALEVF